MKHNVHVVLKFQQQCVWYRFVILYISIKYLCNIFTEFFKMIGPLVQSCSIKFCVWFEHFEYIVFVLMHLQSSHLLSIFKKNSKLWFALKCIIILIFHNRKIFILEI